MHLISLTTWKDIFENWKNSEGVELSWQQVAREKGWPDWESWRRNSLAPMKPEMLSWEMFEFDNPMEEIPAMVMGPYKAWQKGIEEKNKLTFTEFLEIPAEYERFVRHIGVLERMNDFPDTSMIGVIRPDNGKLVCIEGHHRACAVALAKKLEKEIIFKNPIRIAVAKLPPGGEVALDQMLARGTEKNVA